MARGGRLILRGWSRATFSSMWDGRPILPSLPPTDRLRLLADEIRHVGQRRGYLPRWTTSPKNWGLPTPNQNLSVQHLHPAASSSGPSKQNAPILYDPPFSFNLDPGGRNRDA
jgi:hypothetical protein